MSFSIKNNPVPQAGGERSGHAEGRACGFTLIEIIIASALFFGIIGTITSVYLNTLKGAQAGLSQMKYTTQAQLSGQKIMRYIEQSKFFNCVSSSELMLYTPNPTNGVLEQGRLRYVCGGTAVSNCFIRYEKLNQYGCITSTNLLATFVSAISNQPLFSRQGKVVCVNYHVGDPATSALNGGSGPGYQGQEVRFYVTPRNLQTWFD